MPVAKPTAIGSVGSGRVSHKLQCSVGKARPQGRLSPSRPDSLTLGLGCNSTDKRPRGPHWERGPPGGPG